MENETTGIGSQVASWIWEKREQIAKSLVGVYSWFRNRPPSAEPAGGILMLGPGGVGKTTLAKLLAGEFDFLLDLPGEYEESIGVETYRLENGPEVEIVVPPGQTHRREATWTELLGEIGAGKFRGVIVFASYGYHTLGQISYKSHRLYHGNKDAFLDAFFTEQRNDELAVLKQLLPHILQCQSKLWLLTLVTKQDLWWPQRSEVEKYYKEGPYGAAVDEMLKQAGQRMLRHELAFASLVIRNFVSGRGEQLKANVEGYDHQLQVASLRRLFETVDALRRWEEGK